MHDLDNRSNLNTPPPPGQRRRSSDSVINISGSPMNIGVQSNPFRGKCE